MRASWIMALLLSTACGKAKSDECRVTSMGTCAAAGALCGATLECHGKPYELKCTPPASAAATQIDCQCIDGGVIGKSVQLKYPLASTADAVQRACGWQ